MSVVPELVIAPVQRTSTDRKHRQKIRLWKEQSGLCWWCKKPMEWVDRRGVGDTKRFGPWEATIEHLHDRFDPERGKHPGERTKVLAHRYCNEERSKTRQQCLQIQHKWERSRRHKKSHRRV